MGHADDKERLKAIVNTKFDTTIIGAICEFETEFGELWGYGKDGDLTIEEKENLQKWHAVRDNVLNNGHRQRRGLLKEIDMHNVEWRRFNVKMKVKQLGTKEQHDGNN